MALSHGVRPSLDGALVVVATETVTMAMAATATREVALPRRGDAMPKKRGCTRPTTLAPAQPLNGSPAALRRGQLRTRCVAPW